MVLHRVAMRLALPAGEHRAVVGNDEFQSARHGNGYEATLLSHFTRSRTCQSDPRARAQSKSFRETVQTLLMNFARDALAVRCVLASLSSVPDHCSFVRCARGD